MLFSSIIRMFRKHSITVCGMKGTGKDLLFGNVISRRDEPYASNIDYGGEYHQLDFNDLNLNGNTYNNLISGNVKYYEWPYPLGADIYISDAGIYLPSQYCNELNKRYPSLPLAAALSRQLGRDSRFHCNTQNLNRLYDKMREHSDFFITCRRCWYLGGLVIQFITIYDKMQSCIDRVQPCRVKVPLFNKEAKVQAQIYRDKFFNQHGTVENHILIYFNKSSHDTYYFEKLFKEGYKDENT